MFYSTHALQRLMFSLWVMASFVAPATWAQESDDPAVTERAVYIPIKPAFVVNYGGQGPLRYLKAEVSVRVRGSSSNAIRHHMPYIRNNLILLFSRQTVEDLDTMEGKEQLRQDAMVEIEQILIQEEGHSGLEDLYFNQLVVQK